MMIRNLTLVVALGTFVLLGWRAIESTNSVVVDPTTTTEIHSVVLEYSLAMQTGDEVALDEVLHERAERCGYACYSPRRAFAFRHADRRDLLADARATHSDPYFPRLDTDLIEVLNSTAMTASARLSGPWGMEHLHLLRTADGWKIIHVLRLDATPAFVSGGESPLGS